LAVDNNNQWLSLTVPSQSRCMVIVRNVVSTFARQAGFSDKDAHRIVVAVDEACTNTIRHSYKGRSDKRIHIECRTTRDGLEICLRDYGPKIDLSRIRSPESKGRKPGGLGLVLIQNAMDEVTYNNDYSIGLELKMFKRLKDLSHAGQP